MKKCLLCLIVLMLCVSPVLAEETFQSLTKLDEMQALLDAGVTIERVYYTDGYGFSTSEFKTEDEGEIALLWEALNRIVLGERINEFVTDWYPQIVFFLSDGSRYNVCFDTHWLEIGGMENYSVTNDEDFWALTACLVRQYQERPEE